MDKPIDVHTCPKCSKACSAAVDLHDRHPTNTCKNSWHALCSTCANYLDKCPTCHEPKIAVIETNQSLLDANAGRQQQSSTFDHDGVLEISANHIKLAARPFAGGAYTDMYNVCQKPSVAVKVFRQHIVTPTVLHGVLEETRLALSLKHQNVVRLFGVVSIDGSIGILMEKADRGSLRSALDATDKLSLYQQISISIDIVDGLEYIHSKDIVHQDFKPESVLLFDIKSRLTAKIDALSTSIVVQSSLTSTATVGTPYYMAPELFKPRARYSSKGDVYSMAAIFYEVFSGRNMRDAYGGIENKTELLKYIESGHRPELPESLPAMLRTVVERGLSADANIRPTLASYNAVLSRLKASMLYANPAASPISVATASTSTSSSANADTDVYAAFEARLHGLEQSLKAYKLNEARSQVEACGRLWMDLHDRTTATASTARFHSLKGYVHHWFGECPDAYAETYQSLTELYELCVSGTSVEGEQVVKILRYAIEVCESQCLYTAMIVLFSYALRYARSTLSGEAYADVLECFGLFWYCGKWSKIAEFLLSTRLKAAAYKPDLNVAIAHYIRARVLYHEHLDSDQDFSAALMHFDASLEIIRKIDYNHILYAIFHSLGAMVRYQEDLNPPRIAFDRQLTLARRILGVNNLSISLIRSRYAKFYKKQSRLVANNSTTLKKLYENAIKTAAKSLCPNSWLLLDGLQCLADFYIYECVKFQEAEILYLQSIEICKSVYGPGSRRLSRLYASLAETYTTLGQTDKADTYYQLKSEVDSGKYENKSKSTKEALNMLANEVVKAVGSKEKVGEAAGELVDVLRKFFDVAPKPKSQPL